MYILSNVYGDGYLIWVIIKIKNNAQICSVVNEHVYFIISVAESDVKKKKNSAGLPFVISYYYHFESKDRSPKRPR